MNKVLKFSSLTFISLLVAACANLPADKAEIIEITHDGLELVLDSKFDIAYIKPGIDFSGYSKFLVADSTVAFKKQWVKDYRDVSRRNLSSDDLEQMKVGIGSLFNEVFVEELQKKQGYEIVSVAAEDVLMLKPAIIDVEVTAPAAGQSVGRSRVYSSSAGDATLYLEIYDSLSGEILARAKDEREVGNAGNFVQWQNGVTNRAAAKRVFARWANLLRNGLDAIKQREG